MNDPSLHIMVVVEPGYGPGLDWPRTRREAGERDAVVSLLEASASGARWIVPASRAGAAASQVTLDSGRTSALTGAGAAVIDKLFEVQALVPEVETTELRLYAGAGLEEELAAALVAEAAVRLRVFDDGTLRSGQPTERFLAPVGVAARGKVFRVFGGPEASGDLGSEWRPVDLRPRRPGSAPVDLEPPRIVPTGLKAVDLLAPLVRGGHNGIVGPPRSGRLVVTQELLLRLGLEGEPWTVFASPTGHTPEGFDLSEEYADADLTSYIAFVFGEEGRASEGVLRVASAALTMATYSRDEIGRSAVLCLTDVFSVVPDTGWLCLTPGEGTSEGHEPDDASRLMSWPWGRDRGGSDASTTFLYSALDEEAGSDTAGTPVSPVRELDALVVLSREVAARGLYPAVDPLRSTSRALTPEIVGAEHFRVAQEVRSLLRWQAEVEAEIDRLGTAGLPEESRVLLERAKRVRQYLSQNTYMATKYTRILASTLTIQETVHAFATILSGAMDHIDEVAFFNVGPLSDVEERWAMIQSEKAQVDGA